MNSRERIAAVTALEAPDRVPLAPLLDHYAATYAGITNAQLMTDGKKRISAVLKTMNDLGPWDMTFPADTANEMLLKTGVPAHVKIPGKDLPENEIHQFDEKEVLKPEDYDLLLEIGAIKFAAHVRRKLYPELKGFRFGRRMLRTLFALRRDRKMIEEAGAVMAVGGYFRMPFDMFSLGRSMQEFAMDLFDRPEKVKAACKRMHEDMAPVAVRMAKLVGVPRIFIGLARSSPAMISPKHIEEFVWPSLNYYVNFAKDHGITVMLHCDTNWQGAFPMLKKLPPQSCILELDGDTDMFKAKEALGGRMCIMGDVPARLLAFGTRDEVLRYCKRLIEGAGRGGGFILSSGCSIPANAKAENVKAMAEAVEEWGYY